MLPDRVALDVRLRCDRDTQQRDLVRVGDRVGDLHRLRCGLNDRRRQVVDGRQVGPVEHYGLMVVGGAGIGSPADQLLRALPYHGVMCAVIVELRPGQEYLVIGEDDLLIANDDVARDFVIAEAGVGVACDRDLRDVGRVAQVDLEDLCVVPVFVAVEIMIPDSRSF